jgi:hypothetical protein
MKISNLISAGLSVWPIRSNKRPMEVDGKTWKTGQSERLTKEEDFRGCYGVGVICGKISGGLFCIDVDCKYDVTGALWDTLVGEIDAELFSRLIVAKTVSGGYHLFYRVDNPKGNLKLAQRQATEEELSAYNSALLEAGNEKLKPITDPNKLPKVILETRGEGGYAATAPTPGYKIISGSWDNIAKLTEEESEYLLDVCRGFNEVDIVEYNHKAKKTNSNSSTSDFWEVTPSDDYNNTHTVLEILEGYGWKEGRSVPRGIEVKHFSTGRGKSGLINTSNTAVCVHSTSTPLPTYEESKKWLTAFAVLTYYDFSGDFSAAAKHITKNGYGKKNLTTASSSTGGGVNSNSVPELSEYKTTSNGNKIPAETRAEIPTTKPKPKKSSGSGWIDGLFKCLGWELENRVQSFYFHVASCETPLKLTTAKMTIGNLLMLAPLEWWSVKFKKEGKETIDINRAMDFLITEGNKAGYFTGRNIRGRGAWMDRDRVVVHMGDGLLVDWEERRLIEIDSEFIYELGAPLKYGHTNPMESEEALDLVDILDRLNWENKSDSKLLAGWIAIAPVCGALTWRPHIWITGAAGSGKSTVFKDIIRVMLSNICLAVQSATSQAGLMQSLKMDALPILFEEAEGETKASQDRMQAVLSLMRASSSDDGGKMLKGTPGGNAMEYNIRSVFAYASIVPQMVNQSDRRRITLLNLVTAEQNPESVAEWQKTQRMIFDKLTPDYVSRFQARIISLLPILLKSIEIISKEAAILLKSRPFADQFAPMLAGCWHLGFNREITAEEAVDMILDLGLTGLDIELARDDSECIKVILSKELRMDNGVFRSLGEVIVMYIDSLSGVSNEFSFSERELKSKLGKSGLRIEESANKTGYDLYVSTSSNFIKTALTNTPWANNHGDILKRLDGAEMASSTKYFNPAETTRAVVIPLNEVLGTE